MSTGLLALLDDIVALTKLAAVTLDDAASQAATASAKAAGVVIDDAAVTPRYVTGLAAERELPIVWRIAVGSLKNKLVFLLPAALLLTAVAPFLLTPMLMLGGLYLAFEGYEKVHSMLSGPDGGTAAPAARAVDAKTLEEERVAGAIRTDMVLSAEIMAISLANIIEPTLWMQAAVLAGVAVIVTAGVYGAVALIVKADDFGLYLAQNGGTLSRTIGRGLVKGMPPFLRALSFVGMIAMLWVGGGILVHGLAQFGVTAPEHLIYGAGSLFVEVPILGRALAWLVEATLSSVVGLAAGGLVALAAAPFLKQSAGH